MSKPRVFISSVFEGYQDRREAARLGIERAGCEPVLVNEDFPAMATSSRNACLDGVASCDAIVLVLGQRGGWTTPSGKLVVQEEYEEAEHRGLPILVFAEDTKRDPEARVLLDRVSDYVDGHFRHTFSNPQQLQKSVEGAVASILPSMQAPSRDLKSIQDALERGHTTQYETNVRLAIAPERIGEMIDPLKFEDVRFQSQILAIAHSPDVGLLDYDHSKSRTAVADHLTIEQEGPTDRLHAHVRLEVHFDGLIALETNVSDSKEKVRFSDPALTYHFEILESDIEETLRIGFAFAKHLYQECDPLKRYSRFIQNAALIGLGNKKLVACRTTGNSMGMAITKVPFLTALEAPRTISTSALTQPDVEIGRILHGLRHRQNEARPF